MVQWALSDQCVVAFLFVSLATLRPSVHLVPCLNAVESFLWTETGFLELIGERNNIKISCIKIIVKLRDLSVCIIMQSMLSQYGLFLKIYSVSLFYYDLGPRTSRLVNEYVLCMIFATGFMFRPFCLVYNLPHSKEMWDMSGRWQSNRPSPSSDCFSD